MAYNYQENKRNFLSLCVIPLFLFSCQKKESKSGDFKTRTHSELAVLMLQLEQDNQKIKEQLLQGKGIDSLPLRDPRHLLSAKPTFDNDVDSVFVYYANNYIKTFNQFNSTKAKETLKDQYNRLVDACIQCHENKCGGPIVRIKKLYIE